MVPVIVGAVAVLALGAGSAPAAQVAYYEVPRGAHPHDVAPAPDGTVWYTAQSQGALGILDPKTGRAGRFRWARTRRRTASSSAPTAPPGSPTAGKTPSCVSIRRRAR